MFHTSSLKYLPYSSLYFLLFSFFFPLHLFLLTDWRKLYTLKWRLTRFSWGGNFCWIYNWQFYPTQEGSTRGQRSITRFVYRQHNNLRRSFNIKSNHWRTREKKKKKKKEKNCDLSYSPPIVSWYCTGGARSVLVIVAGNGHGDSSSNPGQDWLHFT